MRRSSYLAAIMPPVILFATIVLCRTATAQTSADAGVGAAERAATGVALREPVALLTDAAFRSPPMGAFLVPAVRVDLPGAERVDLVLERFNVTTPATRFVKGHVGGPDEPVDFDTASVVLLRGEAAGFPGSSVFLARTPFDSQGWIDLGPGRGMAHLTTRGPSTHAVSAAGGLPPGVTLCGADTLGHAPAPFAPRDVQRGLRRLQIAIETDYEFFSLFGNTAAESAYIVSLYGAVSTIYRRDLNLTLDVTFVRLWDNPNDLYNGVADPLSAFQSTWNATMTSVQRDVAQYCSGRRDLSAGGVAYLSALCTPNAYSWIGYTLGYFSDPTYPNGANRDIMLAAHELGHNCGTLHTPDYGVDTCNDPHVVPRRGTIMSYCSQTVPGGDAVMDLRFCTRTQTAVRSHVATRTQACLPSDCNQNGVPDAADIAAGTSRDTNGNGVPDECEDCNANGIPDPVEIANGTLADVNANAVPDICEPDCNANAVPDARDIQLTPALDVHLDGVIDSCQPDLNVNGVYDYNEIMADMSLDINRNAVLDAVEDCDHDGVPNIPALAGHHNLWAVSNLAGDNLAHEFYGQDGVPMATLALPGLADARDLIFTPAGKALITSADHRVIELDPATGAWRNLVAPGAGGLSDPTGLALGLNADLFVCSRGTNSVKEYNASTGAFVRDAVVAGDVTAPFGIAFHPTQALLFVTSGTNQIAKFTTASFPATRILVFGGGATPALTTPRGLGVNPVTHGLMVASYGTDAVLEYNADTGAFVRKFNVAGIPGVLDLDGPWTVRAGPDGAVYVSRNLVPELHINRTRVYKYDAATGWFLDNFVNGHATNIEQTTGFDFKPTGNDCNRNYIPDACDIASGRSRDCDHNALPDECGGTPACVADVDDGTGTGRPDGGVTIDDLLYYLGLFDSGMLCADVDNGSGTGTHDEGVTIDDLLYYLARFNTGC